MISILFVDNEHIVVDSLIAYFEKKNHPRIATQGSYSAEDALDRMEHMRIDVLVTDIRMPGMDGLQLQKEVNKRWPDCLTIFLSGYQSFDYVQEAMRNNCFDYVLKSESTAKIFDTVIAAIDKLDERMSNARMTVHADALMQRALPLLQQRLLNDMLAGSMQQKPDFEQSDIALNSQSIWLVVAQYDDWADQMQRNIESVCHLAQACVDGYLRTAAVEMVYRPNGFALLISFHAMSNEERCSLYVQSAVEAMQEQLMQQKRFSISCCISRKPYGWDEIPIHYQSMETQLALSIDSHKSMLLTEKTGVEDAYVPGRYRMQMNKCAQLAILINAGNQDAFNELLYSILLVPERLSGPARNALREEVLHTLLALLMRESNDLQIESTMNLLSPLLSLWHRNAPWSEIVQAIKEAANAVFDCKKQCAQGEDSSFVHRLERIITSNPGGDLSLTRLGDQLGMNPYYMARLYKQLTGSNLKIYVSQVRYQKACEMLRMGLNNRDVAEAVGFRAEQSFNRFFKTISGQTPGEYRGDK